MMLPYKIMPDGVQEVMTTKWVFFFYMLIGGVLRAIHSYLSPFAFTQALLPLLVETAKQPGSDVRIVNVRSPVVCEQYLSLTHPFSFRPGDTDSSPQEFSFV
jgi:hypothetical protein